MFENTLKGMTVCAYCERKNQCVRKVRKKHDKNHKCANNKLTLFYQESWMKNNNILNRHIKKYAVLGKIAY